MTPRTQSLVYYDAKKHTAVIIPVTPENMQQCLEYIVLTFLNIISKKWETKYEKFKDHPRS